MITKLLSGIIVEVNCKPVTDSQRNAVEELVKAMYIPDRDLLMQAHYMFSFSDEVEIEYSCGSCGKRGAFKAFLSDGEVTPAQDDETHERTVDLHNGLRIGDVLAKQVIIRNPSGIVQEAVLGVTGSSIAMKNELLTRVIKKFVGIDAFPSRVISELSTKDRNKILKSLEEFSGKVNSVHQSTCASCGTEVSGTLGVEKYFAGE